MDERHADLALGLGSTEFLERQTEGFAKDFLGGATGETGTVGGRGGVDLWPTVRTSFLS